MEPTLLLGGGLTVGGEAPLGRGPFECGQLTGDESIVSVCSGHLRFLKSLHRRTVRGLRRNAVAVSIREYRASRPQGNAHMSGAKQERITPARSRKPSVRCCPARTR